MHHAFHPAADAVGAVVLVHGFGEHSGRYEHVVAALGAAGLSSFVFDYRGWGRSSGRRAFVRRYDEYLDDVQWAVDTCTRRAGERPFLLGHSQGGLISALYAIERRHDLRGLVLSSPALRFAVRVPRWKRALAHLLSRAWPTFSLPAGLDPEQLTSDPRRRDALRDDPLVVRRATARWYTESLRAQRRVQTQAARLTAPVLFVVGGDDRIADNAATRALYDGCASPDKTWSQFDGAKHEVWNEQQEVREHALAIVTGWLRARALA